MSTKRADESGAGDYLLAGQASELDRLQLQSLVWEPGGGGCWRRSATPPARVRWTTGLPWWRSPDRPYLWAEPITGTSGLLFLGVSL